jgi:mannose-6-phosphate isomerase-like protein (cupin superfamily)
VIVTTVERTTRTFRDGAAQAASRSLARRGFFFSETEAVDHVRLAAGAEIGPRGRRGTEEIWYVASGDGHLLHPDGTAAGHLHPGALAACSLNSDTRLRAGAGGMELVLIAVAPRHLTAGMPPRLPVAS